MLEFLNKALPWVLAGVLFTAGWNFGSNSKDAEWKEVVHNEYVQKSEARKVTQAEVSEVSLKYQEDYAALEGSTDRIIDDLSRTNKRLLVKTKPSSGTLTSDGRCLSTSTVELHESTAKSLISITQKADLKEKALIDTIKKLQGATNGKDY